MNKIFFDKIIAIGRSVKNCLNISNYEQETNLNHKLKGIYSHNQALEAAKLDKNQASEIRSYWKSFNIKCSLLWHQAYIAVNETMDTRYIPETVFYTRLEPWFNRMELRLAYKDKNLYHKLFPGIKMPDIILRNINGMYFNGLYEKLERPGLPKLLQSYTGTFIIKPSLDSGGGKNVLAIRLSDRGIFMEDKPVPFDELEQAFVKDFLIQCKLGQYELFQRIYPHSLNTLRVLSLRFGGKVHVLSSILKMGNNGNLVDNESAGGISCGITDAGILKNFAIDKNFYKYDIHPYTKAPFSGTEIPMYNDVIETVMKLHDGLHYFNLVSWDMAIDKMGEVNLIE
ncbi:sugar-transfer associated ATP-grasp domain-containing protein, partial [Methyloglobulus sp.]|uniref:sugar-transfer associated ATP-grasp domain-containing protein n=1 Tax=Methyloglobulus sp. TaxID=2518622 RepID=UPI00398A2122